MVAILNETIDFYQAHAELVYTNFSYIFKMLNLTSSAKMVYSIFVEISYFFGKVEENEINGGIYNEKGTFYH